MVPRRTVWSVSCSIWATAERHVSGLGLEAHMLCNGDGASVGVAGDKACTCAGRLGAGA